FITQLDHIRIQFEADYAEAVSYEDAPAFRIRLPEAITRLQRREFYRIRIPLGRPLPFVITPDPEVPDKTVTMRVVDLSCGGVALADCPPSFDPTAGHVFKGCRMNLPDLGTVTTDLRVVHVHVDETKAVRTMRFSGQFRNLPDPMMNLIQRYINRVE